MVNLVDMKAYLGADGTAADIPAEMEDAAEEARQGLIDAAAETDDELIMKYLEGEELTEDEVRQGLRQGVKEGQIIPVFCGSAIANIGLRSLVRALTSYVPSPADVAAQAANGEDEPVELAAAGDGPGSCLCLQNNRRPLRRAHELRARLFSAHSRPIHR